MSRQQWNNNSSVFFFYFHPRLILLTGFLSKFYPYPLVPTGTFEHKASDSTRQVQHKSTKFCLNYVVMVVVNVSDGDGKAMVWVSVMSLWWCDFSIIFISTSFYFHHPIRQPFTGFSKQQQTFFEFYNKIKLKSFSYCNFFRPFSLTILMLLLLPMKWLTLL